MLPSLVRALRAPLIFASTLPVGAALAAPEQPPAPEVTWGWCASEQGAVPCPEPGPRVRDDYCVVGAKLNSGEMSCAVYINSALPEDFSPTQDVIRRTVTIGAKGVAGVPEGSSWSFGVELIDEGGRKTGQGLGGSKAADGAVFNSGGWNQAKTGFLELNLLQGTAYPLVTEGLAPSEASWVAVDGDVRLNPRLPSGQLDEFPARIRWRATGAQAYQVCLRFWAPGSGAVFPVRDARGRLALVGASTGPCP